ncbi:Shedu anti-phage system protein SduA domain-containing protein [Aliarcobacter lanthieri]|uniref:Shedu anti-phage system protein SduA domain-containing protein n=1 Tax=Aliarcobacter lanthieri TaxID=1355374 RepID=UPI003AAC2C46
MKISDFLFEFKIFNSKSICRVRLFVFDNKVTAVVTNLNGYTLPSVTNSIEILCLALIEKGYITDTANIVEHYESNILNNDTFDLVIFDENNNPVWKNINFEKLKQIIGCEEDEFSVLSLNIEKFFKEAEKLKNLECVIHNIACLTDSKLLVRKNEIEDKKIPFSDLKRLIDNRENENTIQKLIHKDLTLIVEAYIKDEEYICFSEYPVGEGFVDFVIFSGRSRMQVTLIEIKGAEYDFLLRNHYKKFSEKTNIAIKQIKDRMQYILRNYDQFRKKVHIDREKVENEISVYNSLMGATYGLQVDSNKEICLNTVVIGGRSKNDLEESFERNSFEETFHFSIKIESWDSWLNKHPREG